MFNRKSIYALNKKDPNAIVYTDAYKSPADSQSQDALES